MHDLTVQGQSVFVIHEQESQLVANFYVWARGQVADPRCAQCAILPPLLAVYCRLHRALPGARDCQPRVIFSASERACLPGPRFLWCLQTGYASRPARPIQRAPRMTLNSVVLNEFRYPCGGPYFQLLVGQERERTPVYN